MEPTNIARPDVTASPADYPLKKESLPVVFRLGLARTPPVDVKARLAFEEYQEAGGWCGSSAGDGREVNKKCSFGSLGSLGVLLARGWPLAPCRLGVFLGWGRSRGCQCDVCPPESLALADPFFFFFLYLVVL